MRRLGSFCRGEGVGGAGVHWNATPALDRHGIQVRSLYEERYGKGYIPADMTIQDWGISYASSSRITTSSIRRRISGKAATSRARSCPAATLSRGRARANIRCAAHAQPRLRTLRQARATAATTRPAPTRTRRALIPIRRREVRRLQYCGTASASLRGECQGSPHMTVIPIANAQPNFEMRHARLGTKC